MSKFHKGDPVNIDLGFGMWVSGTVVRQNTKTVRVELNRDIYLNGTREERFSLGSVFHVYDAVFSPFKMAGRPWHPPAGSAIAKAEGES